MDAERMEIKVIPFPRGNKGKTMAGWKRSDGGEREGGTNYLQKNLSLYIWVKCAPPIPI